MYETTAYGAACCAGAGTDHPANSMYTALILPELHPDVPTHVTRVNPQMLEVLQTLSRFVPIRYCRDAEDTIIATMEHYCKACFGETDTDDIRQETIEVCEHFRMNPYQLASSGCLLIVTEDGRAMTEAFAEIGVHAAVIGRLRGDRDKIIRNGEDVRYIDRPAPDEINKLYSGGYDERD